MQSGVYDGDAIALKAYKDRRLVLRGKRVSFSNGRRSSCGAGSEQLARKTSRRHTFRNRQWQAPIDQSAVLGIWSLALAPDFRNDDHSVMFHVKIYWCDIVTLWPPLCDTIEGFGGCQVAWLPPHLVHSALLAPSPVCGRSGVPTTVAISLNVRGIYEASPQRPKKWTDLMKDGFMGPGKLRRVKKPQNPGSPDFCASCRTSTGPDVNARLIPPPVQMRLRKSQSGSPATIDGSPLGRLLPLLCAAV
ncbi:hypothetical protein QBC40DRAFT_298608 [Triangularia verruculosa]|uniref:Uncharacterized protein n=1 Tax=Triangularia verruculosa TaxID=2587418 RepID=A0AAN6XCN9_9PEZI|nr:hypothetical protein QBC40DRAFT_298608 [Triangularia verruculosa]